MNLYDYILDYLTDSIGPLHFGLLAITGVCSVGNLDKLHLNCWNGLFFLLILLLNILFKCSLVILLAEKRTSLQILLFCCSFFSSPFLVIHAPESFVVFGVILHSLWLSKSNKIKMLLITCSKNARCFKLCRSIFAHHSDRCWIIKKKKIKS